MNTRIKYSILLLGVGLILAFLPFNANRSFQLRPSELLAQSVSESIYFSVDQVARFVNNEDSTVQLIDLRSSEQFKECNIPGSINIPFSDFTNPVWEGYLNQKDLKNIFYGNGDETTNYAWTIATGMGYANNYIMKGGLNEWFKTVMLSQFSGEQITPLENARFENRLNARKSFTQINSLPDSLKTQYFNAKRLTIAKLDGGCE
ncbi:MAG TPA: rhodanese-like domain-containing protein [Prolixibacteraceae bacterium]|nr:rhodanese-like domain-containing protein [Prolixibacteraceae bacterium]